MSLQPSTDTAKMSLEVPDSSLAKRYSGNSSHDNSTFIAGDVINTTNTTNIYQKDDTITDLADVVEIPNYKFFKDAVETRRKGTCEWILSHRAFLKWRDRQKSSILWLSADPGCGKSVLASFLVDELSSSTSQESSPSTVCHFFFKNKQRNANDALVAVLDQLFKGHEVRKRVQEEFKTKGRRMFTDLESLSSLIFSSTTISNDPLNAVIILDGLDECQDMIKLARLLKKFFRNKQNCEGTPHFIKIIVTSRYDDKLSFVFNGLPRIKLEDEIFSIKADIRRVVAFYCKNLSRRWPRLEKAFILQLQRKLIDKADQTFLWVSLVSEALMNTHGSQMELNDTVERCPTDLEKLYGKFFEDLTSSRKTSSSFDLMTRTLQIVLGSLRPLSIDELSIALLVRKGDRSMDDLNPRQFPDPESAFKDICGPFVRIIDHHAHLVHATAKDFLLGLNASASTVLSTPLSLVQANYVLAESCITYLNFDAFQSSQKSKTSKLEKYTRKHVFLEYASKNWFVHFREAKTDNTDDIFEPVLALMDYHTGKPPLWAQIHLGSESKSPVVLTILAALASFGLDILVKQVLLEKRYDINNRDSTDGRTALYCAADNGHLAVVQTLLEFPDIQINSCTDDGQSPLFIASKNGHTSTVNALLKAGADLSLRSSEGQTASITAVEAESIETARRILQEKTSLSERNEILHLAVEKQNESLVELILDKGADPNAVDKENALPIMKSASYGDREVTKVLLMSGAKPNVRDIDGRTPLHLAAGAKWHAVNSSMEVLVILFFFGIEVDARDKYGKTALQYAAEMGKAGLVAILLDFKSSTSITDNNGLTALHWAATCQWSARCKHNLVVKQLLAAGAELDARDHNGRTALSWAASTKPAEGPVPLEKKLEFIFESARFGEDDKSDFSGDSSGSDDDASSESESGSDADTESQASSSDEEISDHETSSSDNESERESVESNSDGENTPDNNTDSEDSEGSSNPYSDSGSETSSASDSSSSSSSSTSPLNARETEEMEKDWIRRMLRKLEMNNFLIQPNPDDPPLNANQEEGDKNETDKEKDILAQARASDLRRATNMIKLLLKEGADIQISESKTGEKKKALDFARESGNSDAVKILEEAEQKENTKNSKELGEKKAKEKAQGKKKKRFVDLPDDEAIHPGATRKERKDFARLVWRVRGSLRVGGVQPKIIE